MPQDTIRVVIIGGGISGIAQAIRLRDELGHKVQITVSNRVVEGMLMVRFLRSAVRLVEYGATHCGRALASMSQFTSTLCTPTSTRPGSTSLHRSLMCWPTGRS